MQKVGQIVLETAGVLIALGGLYDIFAPNLPPNLASICGPDGRSRDLVRDLLRALGGGLFAIGITTATLAARLTPQNTTQTLALILLLVLPSEGLNALGMYRARSPFYIPLLWIAFTLLGALLVCWKLQ